MPVVMEAHEGVRAIVADEIPNDVTLAAMQETEDMISGNTPCTWYQSPEDLIDALKKEIDR